MKIFSRLSLVTAAICLALAFVWGSNGSSCLELVHQWHRHEQLRLAATRSADTIMLSHAEYAELTAIDRHEIRYKGQMYDITGVQTYPGGVMLSGHYDAFDRELFKLIDSLLGKSSGTAHNQRRMPLFLYSGILPDALTLRTIPAMANPVSYVLPALRQPQAPLMELPLPPPDRFLCS